MPNDLVPLPERCPECGVRGIARDRIKDCRLAGVEALACPACGEWWLESGGAKLTGEAIARLDAAE